MNGRMIHNVNGSEAYQAYGKEGQAIYSVSRGGLNCVMMDLAEKHGAKIHFDERCIHVDLVNATAIFENGETKKNREINSDLIIGSDGAFSAGRMALQMTDRFEYSQHYLEHGYKELSISAGINESFKLEKMRYTYGQGAVICLLPCLIWTEVLPVPYSFHLKEHLPSNR